MCDATRPALQTAAVHVHIFAVRVCILHIYVYEMKCVMLSDVDKGIRVCRGGFSTYSYESTAHAACQRTPTCV